MIYEAIGVIYKKYDEEVVKTDKGDLHKRRFVLEVERKNNETNEVYKPTYPEFELVGNGCKYWCYNVGDKVTVRFELMGNKYGEGGDEKFYTKLQARRVDSLPANYKQPAQPEQATQPAPAQQPVQGSFDALKQAHQADLPF